jgi:hypothetical protein
VLILIAGLGAFVGSGLCNLFLGLPLTRAFVRILGEERCLSPDSLTGESVTLAPAILVGGTVAFSYGSLGLLAVAIVPAGALASAAVNSIRLLVEGMRSRRREFVVDRDGEPRTDGGEPISARYATKSSGYWCTGPASGFCLYSLVLHERTGSAWSNRYVSKSELRRDLDRLCQVTGVPLVDLVFVVEESEESGLKVFVHQEWTRLICADIEPPTYRTYSDPLPPGARRFWRQWLRPDFGPLGCREVAPAELRDALEAIANAYQHEVQASEELRRNLAAMRRLSDLDLPVLAMTTDALSVCMQQDNGTKRTWRTVYDGERTGTTLALR